MSQGYSEIKQAAFQILHAIDSIAQPRINNVAIKKFWNWFFIKHGNNVIITMQDSELKEAMKTGYEALKPIYEKVDMATQLIESKKLNDTGMTEQLMKMPKFKELMELMD